MKSPKIVSHTNSTENLYGGHSAYGALFLFHLGAGARLALLRFAPLAALAMALVLFLRPEFFVLLISGINQGGSLVWGLFSAGVVWLSANSAAPRIFSGLHGWMGHLPATCDARRRTALAGLWIALVPVLLGIALLYGLAYAGTGTLQIAYLAGLPFLGMAIAQTTFPIRAGFFLRPLCFGAGVLSVSGNWILLGASIVFLIVIDFVSRPRISGWRSSVLSGREKGRGLHYFILWRALRWRQILYFLIILPIFGLTYAYLKNNSGTALQQRSALVFGTALAVVCFVALTANTMAARRPAWPWFRSLPGSAKSRVLRDAGFLFVCSLPLLVPLIVLDAYAVWPVIVSMPALSLYAAAVVRLAPGKKLSALGLIVLNGTIGCMLLTLVFTWAWIWLPGVPLLVKYGETQEQNQKVSRWLEIHHLAAGDPHSWSRQ